MINKPFDFFIQWHLTEACNLRCKHCYQDRPVPAETPFSEIKKTATEARDMIAAWSEAYGLSFTRSMNITGGEPFLRKDLLEVLEEVRELGFEIYLLTNGTLVSREHAAGLANLGIHGVQVSIEGPEQTHDAIRGRGSFSAAAAGVECLVRAGLPVTLNVTLSTLNADDIGEVTAFGARAGVSSIGFSRLVPSGRAAGLHGCMLPGKRLERLYSSLLSGCGPVPAVTGDPIASAMKEPCTGDAGDIPTAGCAAGLAGLTILSDGAVLPCRRLPVPLGNVQRDSLRELWASSPVLEALRDRKRYQGSCGACPRWARCRGCRAIAYAWSRVHGGADFLADDPQCFLCENRSSAACGTQEAGSNPKGG